MYDISTKTVNKLNGELSSSFVNVAEENAKTQDIDTPIASTQQSFLAPINVENDFGEIQNHNNEPKLITKDLSSAWSTSTTLEIQTTTSSSSTTEAATETTTMFDFKDVSRDAISPNNENKVLISSGYANIKS